MKQSTDFDDLEAKAQSLRTHLEERSQALTELEKSFHDMNSLIQKYQEGEEGDMSEVDSVENGDKYLDDKDSLVFHGVDVDMLEEQTNSGVLPSSSGALISSTLNLEQCSSRTTRAS